MQKNVLPDRVWCPICFSELKVEAGSGVKKLMCPKHGEMRPCVELDPLVAAAVAEHCDKVGIVNLEA